MGGQLAASVLLVGCGGSLGSDFPTAMLPTEPTAAAVVTGSTGGASPVEGSKSVPTSAAPPSAAAPSRAGGSLLKTVSAKTGAATSGADQSPVKVAELLTASATPGSVAEFPV